MISLETVTIHGYYHIINSISCAVHIPVTYSITGSLYFLIPCTFLSPPTCPIWHPWVYFPNLWVCFVIVLLLFFCCSFCYLDSTYKSVWLILLSTVHSRSIHIVTNDKIYSFYGSVIYHYMYKFLSIYLFFKLLFSHSCSNFSPFALLCSTLTSLPQSIPTPLSMSIGPCPCSLSWPFPFFPLLSPSLIPFGHCQFVL